VSKLIWLTCKNGRFWNLFNVKQIALNRGRRVLELHWLGGDGGVPFSSEGGYEGSLADTGNGYKIEVGSQYLELDYSEAETLRLLLKEADVERWSYKAYTLKESL
jgi:hypothetical protein